MWSSELFTHCSRLDLLSTKRSESPPSKRALKACSVQLQRSYGLSWPMTSEQKWHGAIFLFLLSQWQERFQGQATLSAWSQHGDVEWSGSWAVLNTGVRNKLMLSEIWRFGSLICYCSITDSHTLGFLPLTEMLDRQDTQTARLNSSPNTPWCSERKYRPISQGKATP